MVNVVVNILVAGSVHIDVTVGAWVVVLVPVSEDSEVSITVSSSILVVWFVVCCQSEN